MIRRGAVIAICAVLLMHAAPLLGQVSFVTIESGEFQGANVVADNAHSWGYRAGAEPLQITGGSFRGGNVSGGNAHSYGLWSESGSMIEILGGAFSGGTAEGGNPHSYGIFNNGGTVFVNGGVFSGGTGRTSTGLYNNGGFVTVSGGTFSGSPASQWPTGILNNGGVVTLLGGEIGNLANNGGSVFVKGEDVELGSGLSRNINGQVLGLGRITGRWKSSPSFWSIEITSNNTDSWAGNNTGIFLAPDTDFSAPPDRGEWPTSIVPGLGFAAVSSISANDGVLRLEWDSADDKQYRVWLKSDLSSQWLPQEPLLEGTGGQMQWNLALNGLKRAFAKIQVLAVPKSLHLASVWTSLTWSGSVPWQYQHPYFSGIYLGQQRVGAATWVTLNFETGTRWPVTISEIRLPEGFSSDFVGPATVRPPWEGGGSVSFQLSFNDAAVGSLPQVLQVISDADNAVLEIPMVVEVLPRHLPEVVQSGRWHDPSTWYDSILPTANDEVYLNGHTVTIDGDISAKLITNRPLDPYNGMGSGGHLAVSDGVTINSDLISAVAPLINFSGQEKITIVGEVRGSSYFGYVPGLVHAGSGTIEIIGGIRGGDSGYSPGVENLGGGRIEVNGTLCNGGGGFSYAIINTSLGTILVNGVISEGIDSGGIYFGDYCF